MNQLESNGMKSNPLSPTAVVRSRFRRSTPTFGRRLALPLFLLCAVLLARPCAATPNGWDLTNSLNVGRYSHTATLLPDGRVLATAGSQGGDSLSSAELYDPATALWSTTGSLLAGRYDHTATLLPTGIVLATGGIGSGFVTLTSAELYDPATGSWSTTGGLKDARQAHTATLLPNGLVLVVGGEGSNGTVDLASAELYDPATGTWTSTGSLHTAREYHTATLLPNGQVLVAAGGFPTSTSAELYDPATGTWSLTGSLNEARNRHTATLLANGTVLAVGGTAGVTGLATAELYGSPAELPTNADGRGTFDNQGNEVTFQFHASQGSDRFIGYFTFCDPAASECATRGRVEGLTISGKSANLSGFVILSGRQVTFNASVTDNGPGGISDTISISLSNGYSAGGTVTSGEIRIY